MTLCKKLGWRFILETHWRLEFTAYKKEYGIFFPPAPDDQIHLFSAKTESWRVLRDSIKTQNEGKAYVGDTYLWVAETRLQGSPSSDGQDCRFLVKGVSQRNCENCKVDISMRQGRSGGTGVKPLLFHYIIKTCQAEIPCW